MKKDKFSVREWALKELKDRKIWIPYMCDSAYVLAAVFRSLGYDSQVLERSKDKGFGLGRKHTDCEQCLPSIITTEDILQRVFSSGFKEDREAFFQGKSEGPCRFGRYYMNQLAILHDLELDNVPIFTLDNRDAYSGMGSGAKIVAWDGMVAQSLLERCLHFSRPFEMQNGKTKEIYLKALARVCNIVQRGLPSEKDLEQKVLILLNCHKDDLMIEMEKASCEFSQAEKRQEKKPVIFITGEIFVRTSEIANQNLIKKIEELGGIALLEPVTSFFAYINELKYREACQQGAGSLKTRLKTRIENIVMRRDEHEISRLFEKVLGELAHDPSGFEIMERGSRYVHEKYKGEAIVSLGSSDYFASTCRIHGIVNVFPFNCMPGTIVSSKTSEFRLRNDKIHFLNLAYDGHEDASRDEQLGVFMYQVRERMK